MASGNNGISDSTATTTTTATTTSTAGGNKNTESSQSEAKKRKNGKSKKHSELATSDETLLRQLQESKTNELVYLILLYIAFCTYLIYYVFTR